MLKDSSSGRPPVTVRNGTVRDRDAIHTIWLAPENDLFLTPPTEDGLHDADFEANVYVLELEGSVIGFVRVFEWVFDCFGIMEIAVAKRREGFGSFLLTAVLEDLFGSRDAHRVGLDVTADNLGAIKCYEALGFVHEGTFRECWKRGDGKYVDCHFMAILQHEWLELRQSVNSNEAGGSNAPAHP